MFQEKVLLRNYSNYKIGGPAQYFFEAGNVDDLNMAINQARVIKIPFFVIGAGTNLLFEDEGYDGLILKPKIQFIEKDGLILRVGAGILMEDLVNYLVEKKLSGMEWAGGLPGTLGGAIYGNAGAFGGEMKDSVIEVVSLDIKNPESVIIKRSFNDCDFGYRSSVFKKNKNKEIITEVFLSFKKGERKEIKEKTEEKINYRKYRQPLEHPNIGSIFKNVNLEKLPKQQRLKFKDVIKTDPFPVVPAAHLISEAGLKGVSMGGAMISPKHPNFIVNNLNASASDVKNLIALIKNKVSKLFKIDLEEEIQYLK